MLTPLLKDLNPSSEGLTEIVSLLAQKRDIKGYKSMPEDKLLSALISSKPAEKSEKPKINFSKARIEKISKKSNESRHKFSKSKISEIRRNLYEIKNTKNLFTLRMGEIEKNLDELERSLSKKKKYYDYHDVEYRGIKDIKDLFDWPTDEDCYKSIIINGTFNSNYIQYESRGNKDKVLTVSEYLGIIRPYLRDMINDHKSDS